MVNLWAPIAEFLAIISWISGLGTIGYILFLYATIQDTTLFIIGAGVYLIAEFAADALQSEAITMLRGFVKRIE